MKIVYSKKFVSEYKKLTLDLRLLAEEKEKIFKTNPFDSRLKSHKLTGRLREYWSFSINRKYRIIVHFEAKSEAWFISIGTHNIYRRR